MTTNCLKKRISTLGSMRPQSLLLRKRFPLSSNGSKKLKRNPGKKKMRKTTIRSFAAAILC